MTFKTGLRSRTLLSICMTTTPLASFRMFYINENISRRVQHFTYSRHAELLAFGSIALSRVLLATRKPFTTIVKMASPDCSLNDKDIPRLEVSITDLTLEDWSWTKVEDAYPHPEQGTSFKSLIEKN